MEFLIDLKKYKKRKALTNCELAQKFNISKKTVDAWMQKKKPSMLAVRCFKYLLKLEKIEEDIQKKMEDLIL